MSDDINSQDSAGAQLSDRPAKLAAALATDQDDDDEADVLEANKNTDADKFLSAIWGADATGVLQDVHMIRQA